MIVPGSIAAVLDALTLRAQLDLRTELRELRTVADAMLAVLWLTDGGRTELLEYAGDRTLLPLPLPQITSSVPTFENVRCRDHDEHPAVVHAVRIGRGMLAAGLLLVDAHLPPPRLVDAVEGAGARAEKIIVRALEPGRKRQRHASAG